MKLPAHPQPFLSLGYEPLLQKQAQKDSQLMDFEPLLSLRSYGVCILYAESISI